MNSLTLQPFKTLRPPRLQFFTYSCRFFLVLFCAGFPPFVTVHLASSYVSLAFLLCTLASRSLAVSSSRVHCLPSYIFRFLSFIAAYLPFAYFSCLPGMFLSVGWEAKEISLHFIPQRVLSRAEKPKRSFNLDWKAGKVFYIVFPRGLVGLRSQAGL